MTAAGTSSTRWVRTAAASLVVGVVTSTTLFAGMVALAPRADAAATPADSSVTVTAKQQDPDLADAPFPDLSVTVSQTKELVSQGIRLTYSGGAKSTYPSGGSNGQNFLQVMECWDTLKDAQGKPILDQNGQQEPDRTTCQFGALNTGSGQTREAALELGSDGKPVGLASEDAPYLYPGNGPINPPYVSFPFRSATGKTLARVVDGKVVDNPPDLSSNEFFGPYSTNEVPWAGFGADGKGTTTFEVQTAMQAPGLGCGDPVTAKDGTVTGQPCWLVIVPRGQYDAGATTNNIKTGLLWQDWEHRLAIPLDFKPVGSRCPLGAAEQQVQGSELTSLALQAWQPVVCNQKGGSIYNMVVTSEGDAAAKADGTGTAPLALVSRPLDTASLGLKDNLTYAPVAVTGLTVAFAVDHSSDPNHPPSADIQGLDQTPFTQMNLTPRLLAKLLTNSYGESLPPSAPTYPVGSTTSYLADNPTTILQDPDFLAVNPRWAGQVNNFAGLGDVFVPLGHSDSAWAVWSYIMADEDARDFLAGKTDPRCGTDPNPFWCMKVNPWATTSADLNATVNPPGIANVYPEDRFPKADPSEVELSPGTKASTADGITWRPYSLSFDQGAYWVLRGDRRDVSWSFGGTAGGGGTGAAGFVTSPRDPPGRQKVLGLTDTASAAQYQVFTAALENPAGQFVVPTSDSMAAAAAAMTPDATQPHVVSFDPTSAQAKAAKNAYPLTVPVYAATNPKGGTAATRSAAAALIRYAAGDGQTPGTSLGQLPAGYAPIPAAWRAQALKAADTIAAQSPSGTETATAPPTSPSDTTTTPPADHAQVPPPSLPHTNLPPGASPSGGPSSTSGPSPSPSSSGPPAPVVGAETPQDGSTGALGAAVPISAAGGLLAAALVPFVARPRRAP